MKNKAMFTALLLLLTLVVGTYGVKGQKSEGNGESFSRFDSGTDRNGQRMIAASRLQTSSALTRPRCERCFKAGVPGTSMPNSPWMAKPFVPTENRQQYSSPLLLALRE